MYEDPSPSCTHLADDLVSIQLLLQLGSQLSKILLAQAGALIADGGLVCSQKGEPALWNNQDAPQLILVLLAGEALQHSCREKDALGKGRDEGHLYLQCWQ